MLPRPAVPGLPDRAGRRRAGDGSIPWASTDQLRLTVYGLGLGVTFGVYLVAQGPGRGPSFWLPSLAVGAAVAAGLLRVAPGRMLRLGAAGAALVALSVPLAGAAAEAAPGPLWPAMLVCLFASRVLAELCDQRFAAAWRAPLRGNGPVRVQSNAAALALGAALTLAFYGGIGLLRAGEPGGTSLAAIVGHALTGESGIHRSIVLLFFVILAYLCDAGLLHRRDREILSALRSEVARARGPEAHAHLRALLAGPFAPLAHTRTALLVDAALAGAGIGRAGEAFDAFHAASRRFVRGLLPFLPLFGFFGTVVGLATAMAALPTGGGGQADLSGSLAGLALKFETTLLGILASMVASVLLAVLERDEAELAAECAMLADAARRAEPGGRADAP